MENNQFKKMLFESQNSFEKQFKGMKPLNEAEQNFKPKLSAKKQLGTYKEVSMNGIDFIIFQEVGPTNKDQIVIKFLEEGSNMKNSITDILNADADAYEWWAKEIVEEQFAGDEIEEFKQAEPEVSYLIENFDALMK